jgi:hypothetical protein
MLYWHSKNLVSDARSYVLESLAVPRSMANLYTHHICFVDAGSRPLH